MRLYQETQKVKWLRQEETAATKSITEWQSGTRWPRGKTKTKMDWRSWKEPGRDWNDEIEGQSTFIRKEWRNTSRKVLNYENLSHED